MRSYFDKGKLAVVIKKVCLVAERLRDYERFLSLARLDVDLHTVSG